MNKKFFKLKIITILLTFGLSISRGLCNNLDELTKEPLQTKSAKLQCNCEQNLYAININWWDNFNDPYLKNYICQTIEKNHELKKAALKTEEYRQALRQIQSRELPTLTFSPTFARIKTARNEIGDIEFAQTRSNIYALPLVAKYEADIFLKNHDKTKSAKLEKQSWEYKEKASNILMASNVATVYINIIKLDKTIKSQESIVKIRKKVFELTKERNRAGLSSTYEVTSTDKLYTQAKIELNDYKRQRDILLHQLAVYTDTCPAMAENLKRGDFDKLEYKKIIPETISSEVISFRPDIMEAENNLKKAKIDIRIAQKEFLPTVQILGVAGYSSLLLERLFDWKNVIALVGAAAFEKIYTGGYNMATLRIKKVQFEELLENYKQTELNAFQEISDTLSYIEFDTQKDNDNIKKIFLEKKNLTLLQERLKAGIISYLDYIQFEERLLTLKTEQNNSKAQRLIDYITLYKVTGTKL